MEKIINRVEKSGLITLDLNDFTLKDTSIFIYEIKNNLDGGLIREKSFRLFLKTHNWEKYRGKYVVIYSSTETIIPQWVYMLLVCHLYEYAEFVLIGTRDDLKKSVFMENINKINRNDYTNKSVIIKGCFQDKYAGFMYGAITKLLLPLVRSLMYGEACSSVPIYKKKQ